MLIVVAAAMVDSQRRILVQRRLSGTAMAGLWEFPGGKIESGEDPQGALVRELREELGIEVDRVSLVPACFASEPLDERHLLLLVFTCRKWTGTPRPHAAAELRWSFPAELYALEMPPADKPLIPLLNALI